MKIKKLLKHICYYLLLKRKPREISRHISQDMIGLDVGAGAGQYTHVLNLAGYQVTAVEPVEEKIGKLGMSYVVAKGQELPFSTKSVDFTFAVNVLHHTKMKIAMLREMGRVSSQVIISEINGENPFVRLYNKLIGENDCHHLSKAELVSMFKSAGLRVKTIYERSFLGVPGVFIYVVGEGVPQEAET